MGRAQVSEREVATAEARTTALRAEGFAVRARYDRRRKRVVVRLSTGVEFSFPVQMTEGLAGASPEALAAIEIAPSGLALHWPALDADLYVPQLLKGVLGSPAWQARHRTDAA